jgi:hypothetical protein
MIHKKALFAAALAVFTLSFTARAGAPLIYTAHELSFSLKVVSQDEASNGDDKPHKESANAKDVFEICMGRSPAKDEAIFMFTICQQPENGAQIIAIDKDPLEGLQSLGTIEFFASDAILTEKNGVLKTVLVPVEVHFSCNSDTVQFEAAGIMELKLSPVGTEDACAESGKIQLTGLGSGFLVNDGSSISIKKRSASISTPPDM